MQTIPDDNTNNQPNVTGELSDDQLDCVSGGALNAQIVVDLTQSGVQTHSSVQKAGDAQLLTELKLVTHAYIPGR